MRGLLGGSFFDDDFPFSGLFGTPMLASPTAVVENAPPRTEIGGASGITAETDAEMSKKREINELRAKMQEAAKAEDFETAMKLRDQIKGME